MRAPSTFGAAMGLLVVVSGGAAVGQSMVQPSRWAVGPKDEEIDAAWPAEAKSKGIQGEATIECVISEKAQISNCKAISEKPAGAGFGQAALSLIPRFKAVPARQADRPVESVTRFVVRIPAGQAFAGKTVDGVAIQLPDAVKEPSPDEVFAAWPQTARANSVEGSAKLNCVINPYGEAADCKVAEESRAGLGFGAAALVLIKKYQYLPGLRDGMSVSMRVPIDIEFHCTTRCTAFTPPDSFAGQLLSVSWIETPSANDIDAAYPKAADATHPQGLVTLFCQMRGDGGVRNCKATKEEPAKQGFGAAAVSLAAHFKGPTKGSDGKSLSGGGVQIPISFSSKSGVPTLVKGPSAQQLIAAYPKGAIAARVDDAKVMLRCKVADQGALQGCAPEAEEPANLGIGAAAMSLVPSFAMSRWSENGRPTIGSSVRIPLHFIVKDPAPAATAETESAMVITEPDWVRKPSGEDTNRLFPDKPLRLGRSGGALMTCKVAVDGSVRECVVTSESPRDMGFGQAALAMAPLFKMRPVLADGRPIEGYLVNIPVVFALN